MTENKEDQRTEIKRLMSFAESFISNNCNAVPFGTKEHLISEKYCFYCNSREFSLNPILDEEAGSLFKFFNITRGFSTQHKCGLSLFKFTFPGKGTVETCCDHHAAALFWPEES